MISSPSKQTTSLPTDGECLAAIVLDMLRQKLLVDYAMGQGDMWEDMALMIAANNYLTEVCMVCSELYDACMMSKGEVLKTEITFFLELVNPLIE